MEGHGGVLAWASNNISCKCRKDLETHDIETLWLEVRKKHKKVFLCVPYRVPNSDDSFWENIQENLDIVKQTYNSKIMLTGDLNAEPKAR
jgi:hypothetical protein